MRLIIYILLIVTAFSCKEKDKRYLVVSKIQSASKLATCEAVVDKVIIGNKEKRLLGLISINEARFVAYSEATIKSGIDLTKIKPDDIKISGKRIELKLPAVEVLDFSYPFEKYKIDHSITKDAFLNKMDIADHEHLYQEAELDIRRQLPFLGIRSTTEAKTRLMLEGLLRNLGYEEIYITFEKGDFVTEVNLKYEEN